MANNQELDNQERGQVFFSWTFPEFTQHERKQSWYIWAGIAVGFFLLYSIIAHNYIFGLLTILSTLILAMFYRSNDEVDFSITEDGILVNTKFYEYKSLNNFFIIYIPSEVKMLYFQPKSIMSPRIPINLEGQDPVKIREVLLQYIDEDLDQDDEPLSDQTSRMLKL